MFASRVAIRSHARHRAPLRHGAGLAVLVGLLFSTTLATATPIRITPLGDSITAGYTDNPTWDVTFEFGYRSGLYTRLTNASYDFQFAGGSLEPWSDRFGRPKTVGTPDLRDLDIDQDYHRGYGGWGVGGLQSNIVDWLNADDPHVVLLMIGINDITPGSSGHPTAVENNLNTLVGTIVSTKPDAHVIVAQIIPYAIYTDAIVQYNSYIRDTMVPYYAGLGDNVTTVDQYSNFLTGGSIDPSLYSNDYNHPNATGYDRMAQTWLEGIQALGTITPPPEPPRGRSVLLNGSFERLISDEDCHNIGVGGSKWAFTGPEGVYPGAGSGIDRNCDYGGPVTNYQAPQGSQMGFIQGAGPTYPVVVEIEQSLVGLAIGQRYTLSFQAKAINGFQGANPFRVSVGAANLEFGGQTLITPTTSDTLYTSNAFTATDSTMTLRFYDEGDVHYEKVSWVDDVMLAVEVPAGANLVANGDFEIPVLTDPKHQVNPAGAGWNFTAPSTSYGSGIDRGNPYGSSNTSNCTPFEGDQMAFLQGAGDGNGMTSIDQDVSGFTVGASYILSFEAKAIDGLTGVNPFFVSLHDEDITFGEGTVLVPGTNYELLVSDPITATAETMNLRFYNAGDVPYTCVSWIDDVKIVLNPILPGDANGDGIVDQDDAAIVAGNWGTTGSGWGDGNFSGDGAVGPADAAILAANWNATAYWYGASEGSAPVPEPLMPAMLLVGLLAAVLGRHLGQ